MSCKVFGSTRNEVAKRGNSSIIKKVCGKSRTICEKVKSFF